MAAIVYPPSLSGGEVVTPVRPDSVSLELGLGGSFRDLLVHEAYVQGLWPLAELISTTASDVSGQASHGTWYGGRSGGVSFDVPEGVLGTSFNGRDSFVEVLDDPLKHLSLASGDMDIAFLMKTTQNDSSLRAVVSKHVSHGGTEGWHVGLISGAVNFYLQANGVVIFDFSRGSVADGVEHLIHCCYETTGVGARIFIDGVQSGAAVTASVEPAITTANLRIGVLNHGDGWFLGSLAMVMIGREGDPAMSPLLQAARTWTDVTRDVRLSTDIEAHYGVTGTSPTDRMAGTGTMQFALNNAANNSAGLVGYYSPGHTNCRAGFDMRIPVRLTLTYLTVPKVKFRGFLATITPTAGVKGSRDVQITAVDWFNEASEQSLGSLETLTSVYSDNAIRYVLDQADRPPPAVELGHGDATFLYALDSAGSDTATILQELQRVNISEYGWLFSRGDGTLVFEGRSRRRGMGENAYTFTETMRGVAVAWDRDALYNNIRVSVYPRQVDTTPSVLFAISAFQQINPGQIVMIDGAYRDPNQRAARVGGYGMITPVATTDYLFNSASDGTGTDMTAQLTLVTVKGGSASTFTLTNTSTTSGYLTKLQIRGQMVSTFEPLVSQSEDALSVRKYRRKALAIDMPYQSWTKYAKLVSDQVLGVTSAPEPVAHTVTIGANRSPALMTQALLREPGDRIGLSETVTGLTTVIPAATETRGHFIASVDLRIAQGSIVTATWGLTPADQIPLAGNSITYIGPQSGQQDLDDGPLILGTPGNYELTVQRGARLLVTGVAGGASGREGHIDSSSGSGGAGGGGGAVNTAGVLVDVGVYPTWIVNVGAGGASGAGADGGDTTFGPDGGTNLLQLQGGRVPLSGTPTVGGLGGTVILGGGVAGTAGGVGKSQNVDGLGVTGGTAPNNATGAAGGGGSGSPQVSSVNGSTGGAGGNGLSASGGAGGAHGVNGTSSSGNGGVAQTAVGVNSSGGAGGGGGVTLHASVANRGGGGGGGGGGQTGVQGPGGTGGDGAVVIALAP